MVAEIKECDQTLRSVSTEKRDGIVQTLTSLSVMQQIRDQQRLEDEGEKINMTIFNMIFHLFLNYKVHQSSEWKCYGCKYGKKNVLDKLAIQ